MELAILIDGEFRSLIRNTLERIIGSNFRKDKNKNMEILKKLSIRVISSLIAIQLYGFLKDKPFVKEYTSYAFLAIFLYFLLTN
jgi:hypothetical protein